MIASLMLAGTAHAGVIDFDDVNTGGDFASLSELSPYAGLSWGADWFAGDTGIDGFAGSARSGANFAINGFGENMISISSAVAFNFAGAWFATPAGVADKASWIKVSAYDALDQLIGSTGNVAIGNDYQWVAAGLSNVSRLSIERDSGWYVMDDLEISAATPVPLPETPLTLAIGALALGLSRRWPRASARGE